MTSSPAKKSQGLVLSNRGRNSRQLRPLLLIYARGSGRGILGPIWRGTIIAVHSQQLPHKRAPRIPGQLRSGVQGAIGEKCSCKSVVINLGCVMRSFGGRKLLFKENPRGFCLINELLFNRVLLEIKIEGMLSKFLKIRTNFDCAMRTSLEGPPRMQAACWPQGNGK